MLVEQELTRSRQTTPSAPPILRTVANDSTPTTASTLQDQTSKAANTPPPPPLGTATLDSTRGKRNTNRKVANGL